MKRGLHALAFVAGIATGKACLGSDACDTLSLNSVPTGEFRLTESWPDGTTGTLSVLEDSVELELDHPPFGAAEATYSRRGPVVRRE